MRYHTGVPIGRGAMAEVFEAWDPEREEKVALKVLRHDDPELRRRLQNEARLQAGIDHPGVCKIFEVGETDDGRAYVAMELVDGRPLDAVADDLTVEQVAVLAAKVAEAVHAAHGTGLIHRDLKPSNILVKTDADGELIPVVVDFGLARKVDTHGLTQTGIAVGTPGYMSPEQAAGDRRLDRRSDVFSLGVILYELLAGRLPFEGESSLEWVAAVMRDDPQPLRRVAPHVPSQLAIVIMTCLERDPESRYGSSRELATDLRRYLAGEPISARPPSVLERGARWLNRNRMLAAVIAAAAFTVLVLAGVALRERSQAARRANAAQAIGRDLEQIDAAIRSVHLGPPIDRRPFMRSVEKRAEELLNKVGGQRFHPGLAGYVRGRVALSLGRLDESRNQLERAWQQGQRDGGVRAVLGRVLAEIYARDVETVRRIRDTDRREQELEALGVELRDPALAHLAASSADWLQPRPLVEARIAVLEERWEDAVAGADQALEEAPWLYEADLLAAQVHLLKATDHEAVGEHDAARSRLVEAKERIDAALAVGRGDPDVHERLCSYWMHRLDLERAVGSDIEPPYQSVLDTCGAALAIDPEYTSAWYKQARAHGRWAEHLRRSGQDPVPTLDEMIASSARAADLAPDDHMAPNMLGLAWWQRAQQLQRTGGDPSEAVAEALAAFDRSLAAYPGYRHPLNNRGNVLLLLAGWQETQGRDPSRSYQHAVEAYEEAIGADPTYALPYSNVSLALRELGKIEAAHGRDPIPYWDRAVARPTQALEINPKYWNALNHRLLVRTVAAEWWLLRDPDRARQEIAAAIADGKAAVAINESVSAIWQNLASIQVLNAVANRIHGQDPESAWQGGREAIDRAVALDPTDPRALDSAGHLALTRAGAAIQDGNPAAIPLLRQARDSLESCLGVAAGHPSCTQRLAKALTLEALVGAPAVAAQRLAQVEEMESDLAAVPGGSAPAKALSARRHAVRAARGENRAAEAGRCAEAAAEAPATQPMPSIRALELLCRSWTAAADEAEELAQQAANAIRDSPLLVLDPLFADAGRRAINSVPAVEQ